MNVSFHCGTLLASIRLQNTRQAYGISSLVPVPNDYPPKMPRLHYLLFDCDNTKVSDALSWATETYPTIPKIAYATRHGSHVIVFSPLPFQVAALHLLECPFADTSHISIGIKRGYWFLENTFPLLLKDIMPIQYMRIERFK